MAGAPGPEGLAGPIHRAVVSGLCNLMRGRMAAWGQIQPPSFVAATAELASIADAGKAWRGPRRSATSPRRQVLPNDRTPRLTGAAPAPGHKRPLCPAFRAMSGYRGASIGLSKRLGDLAGALDEELGYRADGPVLQSDDNNRAGLDGNLDWQSLQS
jgi:hypothetical protein